MTTLIVLLGPTGVGKTELSLEIAERYNTEIVNADSRQLYRELPIGTAAPTPEQMQRVKHFFVGTRSIKEYYSASLFEDEALTTINHILKSHNTALLSGGSMMYIDAVCNGLDTMPTVDEDIRIGLDCEYQQYGIEPMLKELSVADPLYFAVVDKQNPRRIKHALEICRMTGKPYSSFRRKVAEKRPFNIVKIGLTRPREELFMRINKRTITMIDNGFVDEARSLYNLRHINALNTVGYKELFSYFDGKMNFSDTISRIQKNTRVYSKKQMTWFKRDESISWFNPDDKVAIIDFIESKL